MKKQQTSDKITTSFFDIPSLKGIPNFFQESMKYITTQKNLPFECKNSLDLDRYNPETPEQDSNSLQDRLQPAEPTTTSGKKKRNGCTCKKTFCLKMYCQCFALNKKCTEDCVCCDCKNFEQNQQEIQNARNSVKEKGIHNCSLSQKRCNCKKSFCQKKYCECFNSGVLCSQACKCIDCGNMHQQDDKNDQKSNQQANKKQIQYKSTDFLSKSVSNMLQLHPEINQ